MIAGTFAVPTDDGQKAIAVLASGEPLVVVSRYGTRDVEVVPLLRPGAGKMRVRKCYLRPYFGEVLIVNGEAEYAK